MFDIEIRNVAKPVELRAVADSPGMLDGYAASFNRYSQNLGGFVEQVDPGAFSKSLADAVPVFCRYNHDDNGLLGTTEAGTLRVVADDIGLRYEVDLPNTTTGNDVSALAARGDLRYSSFAFHVVEDAWSITEQGFPLRTLMNVQLIDVAPVNNPAYRDTSVGLRSLAAHLNMDVAAVEATTTEELRSLINGDTKIIPPEARGEEQQETIGQVENHPLSTLRQKQLDLLKVK